MKWPMEFASFLERPVPKFIHLAAWREGQAPFGCRCYGFGPEPGEDVSWIYILRHEWLRLRPSLREGDWLAMLLTSGIDNESYQVKGPFIRVRPVNKEDLACMDRERSLIRTIFPDLLALVNENPADCIALGVRGEAVYIQTPGPLAGSLLQERSSP